MREAYEIQFGSIPNAIHLTKGVLERDIEKWITARNAMIIVFCAIGARSVISAYLLQKMGYTNVYSLKGGISQWMSCLENNKE